MSNQDAIKKLLVGLSAYYQQQIPDVALSMYAEDLADIPAHLVQNAAREYRRNPKHTRFPLPAALRAIAIPEDDPEGAAREAAARIIGAVEKNGWPNPDRARAYIGELGWAVVQRLGGWPSICQTLDQTDIGVFQAQARDLAKVLHGKSKSGTLDEAPGLPQPETQQENQLTAMQNIFRRLPYDNEGGL